jgi:proline iminopeptidase
MAIPHASRASRLKVNAVGRRVWADRWIGVVMAGVVVSWAVTAGLWTPRGPLTSDEAIWSMVVSLGVGVGVGVGFKLRSRWAALAVPLVFAIVFELVRRGTDGPTVDGISKSQYGLFAFATGRGFHALVSLFPLAFGSLIGAGRARQISPRTAVLRLSPQLG